MLLNKEIKKLFLLLLILLIASGCKFKNAALNKALLEAAKTVNCNKAMLLATKNIYGEVARYLKDHGAEDIAED